jgi:hypothetical protein
MESENINHASKNSPFRCKIQKRFATKEKDETE